MEPIAITTKMIQEVAALAGYSLDSKRAAKLAPTYRDLLVGIETLRALDLEHEEPSNVFRASRGAQAK